MWHVRKLTEQETYTRFLHMWDTCKPQVHKLLLATIKTDIKGRITATKPKVDDEFKEPLRIDDTREVEEELRRELEAAVSATKLKRHQITDMESNEQKEREDELIVEHDGGDGESDRAEQDWGEAVEAEGQDPNM